ncbi:hypothetical protein OESDEN_11103 [Oesophagostomum dentatum]|uniref:Uncharacterized protein n=1 Tax=Oesophagostomum dentatum TaxID=61180 RepID=A0A0B1SYV0_OESDE|nr:hypothetical protein OESDEN_11103 [Oesophagostomum dentatum]
MNKSASSAPTKAVKKTSAMHKNERQSQPDVEVSLPELPSSNTEVQFAYAFFAGKISFFFFHFKVLRSNFHPNTPKSRWWLLSFFFQSSFIIYLFYVNFILEICFYLRFSVQQFFVRSIK